MSATTLSAAAIAGMIDHAILKPELTRTEVDAQLDVAARYRIFSVCVRPSDVAHAVARLAGTGVAVGTVIGFPTARPAPRPRSPRRGRRSPTVPSSSTWC